MSDLNITNNYNIHTTSYRNTNAQAVHRKNIYYADTELAGTGQPTEMIKFREIFEKDLFDPERALTDGKYFNRAYNDIKDKYGEATAFTLASLFTSGAHTKEQLLSYANKIDRIYSEIRVEIINAGYPMFVQIISNWTKPAHNPSMNSRLKMAIDDYRRMNENDRRAIDLKYAREILNEPDRIVVRAYEIFYFLWKMKPNRYDYKDSRNIENTKLTHALDQYFNAPKLSPAGACGSFTMLDNIMFMKFGIKTRVELQYIHGHTIMYKADGSEMSIENTKKGGFFHNSTIAGGNYDPLSLAVLTRATDFTDHKSFSILADWMIDADPQGPTGYFYRSSVRVKENSYEGALSDISKAISLTIDPEQRVMFYFNKYELLAHMGRYDDAKDVLRELFALKLDYNRLKQKYRDNPWVLRHIMVTKMDPAFIRKLELADSPTNVQM